MMPERLTSQKGGSGNNEKGSQVDKHLPSMPPPWGRAAAKVKATRSSGKKMPKVVVFVTRWQTGPEQAALHSSDSGPAPSSPRNDLVPLFCSPLCPRVFLGLHGYSRAFTKDLGNHFSPFLQAPCGTTHSMPAQERRTKWYQLINKAISWSVKSTKLEARRCCIEVMPLLCDPGKFSEDAEKTDLWGNHYAHVRNMNNGIGSRPGALYILSHVILSMTPMRKIAHCLHFCG